MPNYSLVMMSTCEHLRLVNPVPTPILQHNVKPPAKLVATNTLVSSPFSFFFLVFIRLCLHNIDTAPNVTALTLSLLAPDLPPTDDATWHVQVTFSLIPKSRYSPDLQETPLKSAVVDTVSTCTSLVPLPTRSPAHLPRPAQALHHLPLPSSPVHPPRESSLAITDGPIWAASSIPLQLVLSPLRWLSPVVLKL